LAHRRARNGDAFLHAWRSSGGFSGHGVEGVGRWG
jgi:hypothetical protein